MTAAAGMSGVASLILLAFAPAPSPLPDLHRSPAEVRGRPTEVWNAELPGGRYYTLVGPLAKPWFEGVTDPAGPLPPPRLIRFSRGPLRFAYGVVGGEARSWVFTDKLRFAGRGDRAHLADLAAWTWTWHVRPACDDPRLPRDWFR